MSPLKELERSHGGQSEWPDRPDAGARGASAEGADTRPVRSVATVAGTPAAERTEVLAPTVVPSRAVGSWRAVAAVALLSLAVGVALALWPSAARRGPVARRGLASLPFLAQGAISGAVGADDRAYGVRASGRGFRAANPAQRLWMRFDRSGALVGSGTARLGLGLGAVGYGASLRALGGMALRAKANRVVYARGGLSEWYSNGPAGLEQGFTLARAPGGGAAGPLTLSLALSGDTRAVLAGGGQSVWFRHAGGPSLRYGELVATDARGSVLRSWLELHGGRVLVRVDTRGARFPVRIDPLIQQGAKLTGKEETGEGRFGLSVALSADGNTALIGGSTDNKGIGAAWVFTRSGLTWTQQAKLTGKEETGEGHFGAGVALSPDGNTALVGAYGDNKNVGAAWVFVRSEGKWAGQGSKFTGSGETGEGEFGYSVALGSEEGNTALIGGRSDNTNVGAAWVFTRTETSWSQQGSKLTGTGETGAGEFGSSVALTREGGDTALIGGETDNTSVGAAWVFTRRQGAWSQQGSKLTATGETGAGSFGDSVALSSNASTALIGGRSDNTNVGAAWVFTSSEGKWTQQGSKLTGGSESGEGSFGAGVALSANGNTALIGGYFDKKAIGAAWEFTRSSSTWSQLGSKITGREESGEGRLGISVALSGNNGETGLIGGSSDNVNTGAAWVYTYAFTPEESYGLGPVNLATGNQAVSQTDLAVGGRGPGLHMTRTYNSQLAAQQSEAGPFGYGWTGSYSAHVVVNAEAEKATVYQDNGSTVTFHLTSSGTYVSPGPWVQATLVKEGTGYLYTLPDQTKLAFNSSGQLTSETDRNGNAITLTYNKGVLESVADGAGRKLTFAYKEGQVESIKDPMGHTVKYTYSSGKLASVTLPGEEKARWKFEYDASHQLTVETDGRGSSAKTEYDASHRVSSLEDYAQRKQKLKYAETEAGTEATVTEPNGSTTVEQFNNAGLPTSITLASGTSLAATSTYEYDGSLNLIAMTDPDKHTTNYGYDSTADRTSEKDPNGNETKWTYNGTHDVETMTTPRGETTTIVRNSHGDPETIERPAPGGKTEKTKYEYNATLDPKSETDPLERKTTFAYDKYGDRESESETDPEGDKRTMAYNEDSQETSTVSPQGNAKGEPLKYTTKIELDAQGRPLTVTDPLGHTTKHVYNPDGSLETLTDGNSRTTTFVYNADEQQTAEKEPNGTLVETEYDSAGQPIAQKDGNGHTRKTARNLLEEITEEVDPLSHSSKNEYDAAGNLKKLTDAKGRTTTYTYDPGNRLTEVAYSEEKTPKVKREYDKDGNLVAMTDGTGKSSYTYNTLDQLTNATDGHGDSTAYEYDLAGQQTKLTYPNGSRVTYGYDSAGRVQTITDWLSHETKVSHDANSNVTAITFPSGTNNQDKYAYNEADQMSEANITKSTESLASLVYTRDNDGQLKKAISKGLPGEETTEYSYDENNRLNKAGPTVYEYDAANNPKTIGTNTYTYNNADQLEKGAGGTYTFDELGERLKNTPEKGPATTYGYDQAQNLVSVTRPEEGKTPKIEDTYAYDGNGLRASQTISGTTTHMTWSPGEELLNDGTNSYIYGPRGMPIEQVNGENKVLYLHHDQQGSTRMLTGSTGASEGAMTYDAYGNTTGTKGTATTPLGYDGQYTNADSGLIYLRARTYDPQTAQFLRVDPMVASTGEPYSYTIDDPTNATDSRGLITRGGCVALTAAVSIVGVGGNECIVRDEDANWAWTFTLAGDLELNQQVVDQAAKLVKVAKAAKIARISATAFGGYQWSNAEKVDGLEEWFKYLQASLAFGVGGGYETFWNDKGVKGTTYSGALGAGWNFAFEGRSYTWVVPL